MDEIMRLRVMTKKHPKTCHFAYRYCNYNFDKALKMLSSGGEKEDDRCT